MNRERALVFVIALAFAGAITLLARTFLTTEGESILPASASTAEPAKERKAVTTEPRRAIAGPRGRPSAADEGGGAQAPAAALGSGVVFGRSLGAKGGARTGLDVALYREGADGVLIGKAMTDDRGAFRIEGVPVGEHLLEVRGIVEGFHYARRLWVELEAEIPVDVGGLIVEPAAGRRIRFIIENEGRPLDGRVTVNTQGGDLPFISGRSGADGVVDFAGAVSDGEICFVIKVDGTPTIRGSVLPYFWAASSRDVKDDWNLKTGAHETYNDSRFVILVVNLAKRPSR